MRKASTIKECIEKHDNNYYNNLDFTKLKTCSCCKLDLTLNNFNKHAKQPDGFTYSCKLCIKKLNYTKGINLAYHKSRAKKRGIDFNITSKDLYLPKYCPILEIELNYYNTNQLDNSPSVDRIDNTKGYIKGNVIIISSLANAMKNRASFDELRLFSKNMNKLITNYEMQGALGNITDIFPESEKFSLDS